MFDDVTGRFTSNGHTYEVDNETEVAILTTTTIIEVSFLV